MNRYAIIVAGGIGSRMGASRPKQFLQLGTKPILVHTIEKFLAIPNIHIILTLPRDHFETWNAIQLNYLPNALITVVEGGSTRFHSVKKGLNQINDFNSVVAVHDAVRPLIKVQTIELSFETAEKFNSAVVSVPLKDSIRKLVSKGNQSVHREDFRLIQTPQTFNSKLLVDAYEQDYLETFTDDASVFEAQGHQIKLIEGEYSNIKITTKEDLFFAEAFLANETHL